MLKSGIDRLEIIFILVVRFHEIKFLRVRGSLKLGLRWLLSPFLKRIIFLHEEITNELIYFAVSWFLLFLVCLRLLSIEINLKGVFFHQIGLQLELIIIWVVVWWSVQGLLETWILFIGGIACLTIRNFDPRVQFIE